jgi:acetate kinase
MGRGLEEELAKGTLETGGTTPTAILDDVLQKVEPHGMPALVGHRMVHGGAHFTAPVPVDEHVLVELERLRSLAPLHLPPALDLLRHALSRYDSARHVACFDTAFHRTLPEVARRFALPGELYESGLRRYGFHGLSYEYILSVLGSPPPSRLIVAHLGSGASLCAIEAGRSLDTSMAFTPAGGIPMGTRSGDLDPGILIHLMRERGYGADQLEQLVNHESGLLGLAGSADMSELLSRADAADRQALTAIELFGYAIKKQIGAYVAALGGVDCIVFTGGIGEHAPRIRELAVGGLSALGIQLDAELNAENAATISRQQSPLPSPRHSHQRGPRHRPHRLRNVPQMMGSGERVLLSDLWGAGRRAAQAHETPHIAGDASYR